MTSIPLMRRPALVFALFAGPAAFAIAAFAPQLFHDGDSWWHIAAGDWMVDHHAVLRRDVFSFTFAGRPWDAQEWLSEILMALSFRAAGWNGLHLLFGAAMGAAAALVSWGVRQRTAMIPALVLSVLGIACVFGSLLARPHLLALPLLALWTLELLRAREQTRAPRLVASAGDDALGQPAWQLCLRPGVGLRLRAGSGDGAPRRIQGLGRVSHRGDACGGDHAAGNCGIAVSLSIAATGQHPQRGRMGTHQPVPAVAIPDRPGGTGVSGCYAKTQTAPIRLLIVIGLVYLALAHVRHQMLFGIVVPLIVAAGLKYPAHSAPVPRWLAPLGAAGLILLIVVRLFIPTLRGDDSVTPMTALASVPPSLRAQPVLNAYDFGGYLIFQGVKVFVDGRTDMYGDAFLGNYDRMMKPDAGALQGTLARWHIAWTILPPGPAAQMMDGLPGWHRLYSDRFAVVHSRDTSF